MSVTTAEARYRMKAKLEELARAGIRRVLLYGAGRHTLKVGEVLGHIPVEIPAIVDDERGGRGQTLWNWPILTPAEALRCRAQAVVISSDGMEDRLYAAASRWFRQPEIAIHRLYGFNRQAVGGDGGNFTDSTGTTFTRLVGYRCHVKPGWEEMLHWKPGERPAPTPEQARAAIQEALKRVRLLERYLRCHGFSIRDRDALEIGCWDGSCALALAAEGCRRVVGVDYQDYFLCYADPDEITDYMRDVARNSLLAMQAAIRQAAAQAGCCAGKKTDPPAVELLIDDITSTHLDDARFDLICSWGTLEHIVPPEAAFAAIARLLRPGGLSFCGYTAFSSQQGGHALCTMDFPWGHVRLGEADVDRYLRQFRPQEHAHAIRHYRRYLNRLTLADVQRLSEAHGLNLIDKTVWLNRQQFEEDLEPEYLENARRHYPNSTIADLVHDDIWLLMQKPS